MEFLPDGSPEITELLAFTGYSTFSSDIHVAVRPRIPQAIARDAEAQIANRTEAALSGIPATLAAIKKAAESG